MKIKSASKKLNRNSTPKKPKKKVSFWWHKHFLSGIIGCVILLYCCSFACRMLGDMFLKKDNISLAQFCYTVAQTVNPFSAEGKKRLAIISVIQEERKGESEETTAEEKSIAISYNSRMNTAVLGTSTTIPVLMYHYIRINPDSNDRVGYNLSVTPENFDLQMDYLARNNFHTITLQELANALLYKATLPTKPIVITFDDGYSDSYYHAFPILRKYHFTALNFIITGFVNGPMYLTWDQIHEMQQSGTFTFGSHTVNHVSLPSVSDEQVIQELRDSKTTLTTQLGTHTDWLAYPYGNVTNHIASLAKKAGYKGAFGTNFGSLQSPDSMYTLPRIRIGGSDTVVSFAGKLPWQ